MVKLIRLWDIEFNNIASVLNRPRISMELDRYIWNYIDEKIVQPKKIMQSDKWVYKLVICFNKYNENKHKFFRDNEYNPNYGNNKPDKYNIVKCTLGEYDRLFCPDKFRVFERVNKSVHIGIYSPLVDANITPEQYADLLFDGFGSILVYNFNKVKKEELDEIKQGLSKEIITSFQFPAPFEKQEYMTDENTISFTFSTGKGNEPTNSYIL